MEEKMLSFEEFVESVPNPSYKGYYKDYEDYLEAYLQRQHNESMKELKTSIKEMYRGADNDKQNDSICPHCNKPLQKENAVLATTYERELMASDTTYLPAGGWRKREQYKTYKIKYYRCRECDRIIKHVKQIQDVAQSRSLRIALIVFPSLFIISVVISLLNQGSLGWGEVLGALFFWGFIYGIMFITAIIFLPELFSKEAKEILKETGIIMYPTFSRVHRIAEMDKAFIAMQNRKSPK